MHMLTHTYIPLSPSHRLGDPAYVALFMPPLCTRLTALAPHDRDLIPLLECITTVRALSIRCVCAFICCVFSVLSLTDLIPLLECITMVRALSFRCACLFICCVICVVDILDRDPIPLLECITMCVCVNPCICVLP